MQTPNDQRGLNAICFTRVKRTGQVDFFKEQREYGPILTLSLILDVEAADDTIRRAAGRFVESAKQNGERFPLKISPMELINLGRPGAGKSPSRGNNFSLLGGSG